MDVFLTVMGLTPNPRLTCDNITAGRRSVRLFRYFVAAIVWRQRATCPGLLQWPAQTAFVVFA